MRKRKNIKWSAFVSLFLLFYSCDLNRKVYLNDSKIEPIEVRHLSMNIFNRYIEREKFFLDKILIERTDLVIDLSDQFNKPLYEKRVTFDQISGRRIKKEISRDYWSRKRELNRMKNHIKFRPKYVDD